MCVREGEREGHVGGWDQRGERAADCGSGSVKGRRIFSLKKKRRKAWHSNALLPPFSESARCSLLGGGGHVALDKRWLVLTWDGSGARGKEE